MSDIPALDVAIGLSFVFFILAVFATAITEAIASACNLRARTLEGWLKDNLTVQPLPQKGSLDTSDAQKERGSQFKTARAGSQRMIDQIYAHPAVNSLTRNGKITGKPKRPSYLPADSVITALLESTNNAQSQFEKKALPALRDGVAVTTAAGQELHELINDLPKGSPIQIALIDLWNRAGADEHKFRLAAEKWFDHAMERLSGWYKRRAQLFLWLLGLTLACVLNVDAIHVTETLWRDQSARAAVTKLAQTAKAPTTGGTTFDGAYKQVQNLPLPIGWDGKDNTFPPDGWQSDLIKILGLLLTSAAVGMGAPFWFDTLSRLGSLRGTGPKPTTSPEVAAASTPAILNMPAELVTRTRTASHRRTTHRTADDKNEDPHDHTNG